MLQKYKAPQQVTLKIGDGELKVGEANNVAKKKVPAKLKQGSSNPLLKGKPVSMSAKNNNIEIIDMTESNSVPMASESRGYDSEMQAVPSAPSNDAFRDLKKVSE